MNTYKKITMIVSVLSLTAIGFSLAEEPTMPLQVDANFVNDTTPEEVSKVKYKLAPKAIEWLEMLGFIKKQDVIDILREAMVTYQDQLFEVRDLIKSTPTLSVEEIHKLKFLLKQVIAYK